MSFLILYERNDPVAKGVLKVLNKNLVEDYADIVELPYLPLYLEDSFKDYESIIVLSIHDSKSGKPSLTVHSNGNFTDEVALGGKPLYLSYSNPYLNSNLLRNLYKYAKVYGLTNEYEVCFEATHHGPTIDNSVVFLEIGSDRSKWNDQRAHKVLAMALEETLEMYKDYPKAFTYLAIGGTHYAPKFTKLCLNEQMDIGHIIPKYVMSNAPLEMIDKAFERTINCKKILIEWKSVISPFKQYVKEKYEYIKI